MEVSAKAYTDASTTQGAEGRSEKHSTNQTKTAASGQESDESGVRPSS
jgi:hypothetical protein